MYKHSDLIIICKYIFIFLYCYLIKEGKKNTNENSHQSQKPNSATYPG